jgi:hypothetical protein
MNPQCRLTGTQHKASRGECAAVIYTIIQTAKLNGLGFYPAAEPRLGRRMARTLPLLPPPQKN